MIEIYETGTPEMVAKNYPQAVLGNEPAPSGVEVARIFTEKEFEKGAKPGFPQVVCTGNYWRLGQKVACRSRVKVRSRHALPLVVDKLPELLRGTMNHVDILDFPDTVTESELRICMELAGVDSEGVRGKLAKRMAEAVLAETYGSS